MNQPKKVLLIEDHEIARKITVLVLTQSNCQVTATATAAAGLEHMQKNQFDFVFVDIGLPDMDGFILIEKLRALHPTVPIAALTANEDQEYKRRGLSAGMTEYIVKPLTLEKCRQLFSTATDF